MLDFGIARLLDGLKSVTTTIGSVLGTPAFMPPEQAFGKSTDIDAQSDLWAVGATMFTLVSGAFVHEGESSSQMLFQSAMHPARSVSVVAEGLAAPLVKLIDTALAYKKTERWPSAEAMRAALHAAYLEAYGDTLGPDVLKEFMAKVRAERVANHAEPDVPTMNRSAFRRPMPRSARSEKAAYLTMRTRRRRKIARIVAGATVLGVLAGAVALGIDRGARVSAANVERAPPAPACVSNTQCTHDTNAPAICRKDDGACVPLAAPGCTLIGRNEDYEADGTVWFGAMFPLSGPRAEVIGRPSANAVEVALRDFRTAGPSAAAHTFGVIMCDDADADGARRAAQHLVHDVRTPAVIGFHRSKEVTDLALSQFIPNDVLSIAAINRSSMITDIPHAAGSPRLVFRAVASETEYAKALARVVSEVFEQDSRGGALGKVAPMRMAVVRANNSTGLSQRSALLSALRFNGKSASENGENFRDFVLDERRGDDGPDDHAALVAELVAFRPHAILEFTEDFATRILPKLEEQWPESAGFRPLYATYAMQFDPEALYNFIGKSAERRRRFFGVELPSQTGPNIEFAMSYNQFFSPKVTPSTTLVTPYDAFYVLAYATFALGDEPVTGPNLARAIGRLVPPGQPIDVGPTKILEALNVLQSGKNIDLNGAATNLDFDLNTGEVRPRFAVYCVKPDASGQAHEAVESGLFYDARTDKLEGTRHCP